MKKLITVLVIPLVITVLGQVSAWAVKPLVKEPNVSGSFYPSDAKNLSSIVEHLLAHVPPAVTEEHICGIIVPHAGYIYSGKIAASAYKAIYMKNYSTVIILAPSHYHYLKKAAVYKSGSFKTPLGLVPVDSAFTNELLKNSRYFAYLPEVFEKEHAIEVQIPFLQKSLNKFSIVPIIISESSFLNYERISDILVLMTAKRDDVLIVASTDLSHFHDQKKANMLDRNTLSFIVDNNAQALFDNTRKGNCELCGSAAVITLMLTMKKIGADHSQILAYATSADTTNSSTDRVVGYSSVIYSKPSKKITNMNSEGGRPMLTQKQKKELLTIARTSIQDYLRSSEHQKIQTDDPIFLEHRGAFVTLHKNGRLRGCIGRIVSDAPLIEVISEMGIAAATADPRFPKVTKSELDSIDLEISVMSPIKEITDTSLIEVGKHGIIIRKEFASGLLLPQVATEYGWDTKQFLEQTCIKAGLEKDTWKKGARIFIFSAEVFGEKD